MKKIIIIASLFVVGVISAMAQGKILFGNTSANPLRFVHFDGTTFTTNIVGTATSAYGLGPGSVRVSLLVGANGAALSSMVPVMAATSGGPMVTNSTLTLEAAQGTFGGGSPLLPTGYAWSDGLSLIQFAYVAWSISTGVTSYTQFFDFGQWTPSIDTGYGYATWSGIIQGYDPGQPNPPVTAPATFGTNSWQSSGLVFETIPEPGTFLLAGLSAVTFLLFRRRN
jgi:hypothetical protein